MEPTPPQPPSSFSFNYRKKEGDDGRGSGSMGSTPGGVRREVLESSWPVLEHGSPWERENAAWHAILKRGAKGEAKRERTVMVGAEFPPKKEFVRLNSSGVATKGLILRAGMQTDEIKQDQARFTLSATHPNRGRISALNIPPLMILR